LAKQYHLSLMGILDQHLLNWSSSFNLTDWSNMVTQAVESFSDVKTWEIWNEPSMPDSTLGYYNGSAEAYVAMLQTAYGIIKSLAPSDTVIGLGGVPLYDSELINGNETLYYYTNQAYAWATQVVQLGGMNYCDAIAVHAYPYGAYIPVLAGSSFTYYLQQYEQLCAGKPVWVTEVGTESQSTTWAASQAAQATFLQQSYTMFQGLGVKAYLWYELNDGVISGSYFGLFDGNGNPKQAFTAYVNLVNGATSPTATATSTAQPTQNPDATPSPSLVTSAFPSQQPTTTPSPTNPPAQTSTFPFIATAATILSAAALAFGVLFHFRRHPRRTKETG